MAKRCQRCGCLNDDSHYFCQQCSEALDDNVRVLLDYNKMKAKDSHPTSTVPRQAAEEDYAPFKLKKEEKSRTPLWITLLCLAAVAAAVYFLLLR